MTATMPGTQANTATLGQWASWYASRGLRVFPLPAGRKAPPPANWPQLATTDAEQVSAWWRANPDANIAVRLADHEVIDLDAHHVPTGVESVHAIYGKQLPPVLCWAATAGGGFHGWIPAQHRQGSHNGCRPSVDYLGSRADGSGARYVVMPPSRLDSGSVYLWRTNPVFTDAEGRDFSGWLKLLDPPTGTPPPGSQADAPQVPPSASGRPFSAVHPWAAARLQGCLNDVRTAREGQRNDTLNKAAIKIGHYIDSGSLDQGEVTELLHDAGRAAGLEATEIRATVQSGLAAGMREPLAIPEREPLRFTRIPQGVDPGTGEILAFTGQFQRDNMQDAHLGERVAREHLDGKALAWGRHGWSVWDERRWATATETTVRRLVRDALLEVQAEELRAADQRRDAALARAKGEDAERAKEIVKQATQAHEERTKTLRQLANVGKIDAVMKVARGFIEISFTEFDHHPDLLNAGNGIIDLRTGQLQPHDPALLLTKLTEVNYRPGSTHDDWNTALQALPEPSRQWMQLRFGQAATGYPPDDDIVPFLKGGGANGKSTLLAGIQAAMGDHCVLIPDKALLGSISDHPTELMPLKGARLALLEELPEGDFLNINRLKKIMGSGQITARGIGEDNTTWQATHALMVTTNYTVQVAAADHGTWRRLAEVGFPYTFTGPNADRPADPRLRMRITRSRQVHEAVLSWIVAGARSWYLNGRVTPDPPQQIADDTQAWMLGTNDPALYLSEALELDANACVLCADVYTMYADHARDTGKRILSDQRFWERAGAHQWLASQQVERGRYQLTGMDVSRPLRLGLAPLPQRPTILTGARWRAA